MLSKAFWIFVSVMLLVIMGASLLFNPSYEKSLEAKYFYSMGEYKKAFALAQEAFSLDQYNRMAATMMAQSQISLEYYAYVEGAKKYLETINKLAQKPSLSEADRAKIKIISEIVIGEYEKLAPSVVTDKKLITDAAHYHELFVQIHEKIISKL